MTIPNAIPTLGNPDAPHLYRIGVEHAPCSVCGGTGSYPHSTLPEVTLACTCHDGKITGVQGSIEVHARTRWSAMALAEKAGYVVRDCNMIG